MGSGRVANGQFGCSSGFRGKSGEPDSLKGVFWWSEGLWTPLLARRAPLGSRRIILGRCGLPGMAILRRLGRSI